MISINELAPDVYRLSVYVPDIDMQFNHFLVRDEEPLLFHALSNANVLRGRAVFDMRSIHAGVEAQAWEEAAGVALSDSHVAPRDPSR